MWPAPDTPPDAFTAARTSPRPSPRAASASGLTRTSIRRICPPYTVARATPFAARMFGRTVQSTRSRNCMGVSLSEVNPTFSRSIVDDVSGVTLGVVTPAGKGSTSLSASETTCRARKGSDPSEKITVIADRPAMDSERIADTPADPLIAASTGRVTSCSTCSAVSPGASV